jgi:AmmeMemoRadiSam system protein B
VDRCFRDFFAVVVILVPIACSSPIGTEQYFSSGQITGQALERSEGERAAIIVVPHFFPLAEIPLRNAYQKCRSRHIRRVILISPDHFGKRGECITTVAEFSTHFGTIVSDRKGIESLIQKRVCTEGERSFRREHGILVHLPFIKYYFPRAEIIPLIVPSAMHSCSGERILAAIQEFAGDETLLIISTDFSHYRSLEQAVAQDMRTARIICSLDFSQFHLVDVDCRCGMFIAMKWAQHLNLSTGEIISAVNSAEVLNNPHLQSTTGMVVIAFFASGEGD